MDPKDPGIAQACALLQPGEQLSASMLLDSILPALGGAPAFWQTVVELLGDAVFLVGPDRRILYWNRAAEALTGYRRDEVVGSNCLAAVHCDVCEHRCGVFDLGEIHDVPLVLRNRAGDRVEVVKNASVVRDASGAPLFGVEVLRNMTEWNARERSCTDARLSSERQQQLLRSVLDAVSEGIVGVAADGTVRLVSASAEAMLRTPAEEAEAQPLERLAGPEVAGMVRHVLASGAPVSRARVLVEARDGAQVPVAVSVAPMKLADAPDGAMLLVRDLRDEERQMRERMSARGFAYGTLVSRSAAMQRVFDLVDQVAPTGATVLIQGESGTGKELVAREIHKRSRRAGGPFHAVNCAAIASEILESEFFGHEKGAFTGAVALKRGRFEVAHTGTIFLDEVAELPLELQAKLLRVLEEKSFERVGGTRPVQVDLRLVAATHRDLAGMVAQGRFREDLYYRLRVVPIGLPALRERVEDVELLAAHFLARLAEREGREPLRLASDAVRVLLDHTWPGNVRELANVMEYVAVVSRGPSVHAADLPRDLRTVPGRAPSHAPSRLRVLGSPEAGATAGDPPAAPSDLLLRSERARIEAALGATRYSLGKAASLLGMHRTTLYRKRLRFGI